VFTEEINKILEIFSYKSSVKLFADKPLTLLAFLFNHSSSPKTLSALTEPEIPKLSSSSITNFANFF